MKGTWWAMWMLLGLLMCGHELSAQHSTALWDDSRVSSIHVTIASDSLDAIYANVFDTHYFQAEVVFDDGTARDTIAQVGLRLRGNTSRTAAKKSFKLSFNEYLPGRRYQGAKKLNLNGQHNDPTMIREKLFYEVWGKSGLAPRRTTFVELYINQVYYGLYTCLEELDKDWLTGVYGENDGNLYKCIYPADLVYMGTNQQAYKNILSASATGGRAYDLQTNDSLDDYSDLVTLITQLDRNPDAAFAADIPQYLNVNAVLKTLAIDVATGNWDDYAYNKNNYFLYHNLATGQFEFVTYDTDNTFGVDWVQRDWATRDCRDWLSHSEARPLASKLLAVPSFLNQYYGYLDSITRNITRPDSIFPRIDALKNLIQVAAQADTFRSLDFGYNAADFELGFTGTVDGHTPYGIKPFLGARYQNTLAQLSLVAQSPAQGEQQAFLAFPNPLKAGEELKLMSLRLPTQALTVQLLNARGQSVGTWQWPQYQNIIHLDVHDLPSGPYLLRITGKGVYGNLKIVRL